MTRRRIEKTGYPSSSWVRPILWIGNAHPYGHGIHFASADDPARGGPTLFYNVFQQGQRRIWAPDAVLGDFSTDARANVGLDIIRVLNENSFDLQQSYLKQSMLENLST